MDPADVAGSQLAMNNRHPMGRHVAMPVDTAIHAENNLLKRRLRQYATTLQDVTLRAKEEVTTALQQRNEALSKSSSVEFERDEALEESNALRSALHELRTRHEETTRSLLEAQERYGKIREDSNAAKTELKRLRSLSHALEKRLRESDTQNAKYSALAQANALEMKNRTDERDTLRDELIMANSELNATKRELAITRHTLATQAPPEISPKVRADIARSAAEQVEKRTLSLLRDIAQHYVEFQLSPANNNSINSRSYEVGGPDEDTVANKAAKEQDELASRVKELAESVLKASNDEGDEEGIELPVAEDFLREHLAFVKKLSQTSHVVRDYSVAEDDDSEDDDDSSGSSNDSSSEEESDEEEESESEIPSLPPVTQVSTQATTAVDIDNLRPSGVPEPSNEESREIKLPPVSTEAPPTPVETTVVNSKQANETAKEIEVAGANTEASVKEIAQVTPVETSAEKSVPDVQDTQENIIQPKETRITQKTVGNTIHEAAEEVSQSPAEVHGQVPEQKEEMLPAGSEKAEIIEPVQKEVALSAGEEKSSPVNDPPSTDAPAVEVETPPSKTENKPAEPQAAEPEANKATSSEETPDVEDAKLSNNTENGTEKVQEDTTTCKDNGENNEGTRSIAIPSEVVADINKAVLVEGDESNVGKVEEKVSKDTKKEKYDKFEGQKKGQTESRAVLEEEHVLMDSVIIKPGSDIDPENKMELAELEEEEAKQIMEIENMIKGIGLDVGEDDDESNDGDDQVITSSMEMDPLMAEINETSREVDEASEKGKADDDAEIRKIDRDTQELLAAVSELESAVEVKQERDSGKKFDTVANAARIASANANSASIKAHVASVKARIASVEARIASIEAIKAALLSGNSTTDAMNDGNETSNNSNNSANEKDNNSEKNNDGEKRNNNNNNSSENKDKENDDEEMFKSEIDENALAHEVFRAERNEEENTNYCEAAVYLEDRNVGYSPLVASRTINSSLPTGPPPVVLMDSNSVATESEKTEEVSPMSVKEFIRTGDVIGEAAANEAALARNAAVNELSKRISKVSAVYTYADVEIDVSGTPDNNNRFVIDDEDDITEEDYYSDSSESEEENNINNFPAANSEANNNINIPRRPAWPPPSAEQFRRMPPHARDAFR